MRKFRLLIFVPISIIVIYCLSLVSGSELNLDENEKEAAKYLASLEPIYSNACNIQMVARWEYITNVTDSNEKKSIDETNKFADFQSGIQRDLSSQFPNWKKFKDEKLKREIRYLATTGPGNLPQTKVAKMNGIQGKMESAYAKASVCEYKNLSNCNFHLEPEITEKLIKSSDYDELAYYWTSWHDKMGSEVKSDQYSQFIELQNEMARKNGFNDMSEWILDQYDDGTPDWSASKFKKEILEVWTSLKPYYDKLHAYVRMELKKNPDYGKHMGKFGPIPAHLFGNMWAQQWSSIENKTKLFPGAPSLDATQAMIKNGYTEQKIFEVADEFFSGMGLEKMTDEFWKNSMLTKPKEREVVCHASAEDFCTGKGNKDFRIKMCTTVDMDHLVTAHHEMGHIEYFMQYRNESYIFRNGANPGFHEAIGDSLALAVTTPKHLQCYLGLDLGLGINCDEKIEESSTKMANAETQINFLYLMALDKIAFLPFAISMESWRWEVYEGKLNPSNYNDRWWEIRQSVQGIVPPSPRPSTYFDPAAKYHIVANVEYIRYFISYILQFQLYEAMCIEAGEFDPNDPNIKPLHECDFGRSLAAGKKLGDMMKVGFSKPWPEALSILTGGRNLSTHAIINYFSPLFNEIEKRLIEAKELPCSGSDCEEFARDYLENIYEPTASKLSNNATLTLWDYETDLNSTAALNASREAKETFENYKRAEWREGISQFNFDSFSDESSVKRQLQLLNHSGVYALSDETYKEYNNIVLDMADILKTAKICPYFKRNCSLETSGISKEEVEKIIATSTNYNELSYIWEAWRNATSKKIRKQHFERFISISNEAAVKNGFSDLTQYWINTNFEMDSQDFKNELNELWEKLKPLYDQLHAYVRSRLVNFYPEINSIESPLKSHILGSLMSMSWENLFERIKLFEEVQPLDTTKYIQTYSIYPNPERMLFDVAAGFYRGLVLGEPSMAFGEKALIKKPLDKEIDCSSSSAWDFSDGQDFRIKMCTNLTMDHFIAATQEIGNIIYQINYKSLPIALRKPAFPGLSTAISEMISLSASTIGHSMLLFSISDNDSKIFQSPESMLNTQLKFALKKLPALSFNYLIDSYRFKVFSGEIPRNNFTYTWLKMSSEIQGVLPNVMRSEEDLDFAAFNLDHDAPIFASSFLAQIISFQLHKTLCEESGEYPKKPLYMCNLNRKVNIGAKIRSFLEAGASMNWKNLLSQVFGIEKLDVSPLLEYFNPLFTHLQNVSNSEKYPIGWDINSFSDFYIPPTDNEDLTTEKNEETTGESGEISEKSEKLGIIIGSVVGGLIILVLVGFIVYKYVKKTKTSRNTVRINN